MNNDIYEVTRDDYVGFLWQIKKEAMRVEEENSNDFHFIKTYSVNTGNYLCMRMIPSKDNKTDIEHYYIFNMPEDNERQPPKPVRKIVLETKEEVQEFFNILSKINKKDLNK